MCKMQCLMYVYVCRPSPFIQVPSGCSFELCETVADKHEKVIVRHIIDRLHVTFSKVQVPMYACTYESVRGLARRENVSSPCAGLICRLYNMAAVFGPAQNCQRALSAPMVRIIYYASRRATATRDRCIAVHCKKEKKNRVIGLGTLRI